MNVYMARRAGALMLLLTLTASACGGGEQNAGQTPAGAGTQASGGTAQINGAGATFPNPIYSKWFSEYEKLHPNVQINYQSVGSGGGIRQLVNETVFFGATDGPMTDEQLKSAPARSSISRPSLAPSSRSTTFPACRVN